MSATWSRRLWRRAEGARGALRRRLELEELVGTVGSRREGERVVLRLVADRLRGGGVVAVRDLEPGEALPGLVVVGLQARRLREKRSRLGQFAPAAEDPGLGEQRL